MADDESIVGPAARPPTLRERVTRAPVTFALAAVNVAVFIWVESKGSTLDVGTLLRFGAVEQTHVASGEVWRVLTPMFLHVGWMHLLWNTYASLDWCTLVESVLGKLRFLAIYLLAGIGGAAASALFWQAVGAGASGAMFGVVGATFVLRYRVLGSLAELVRDRFFRSTLTGIAIWTALGFAVLKLDHFAHFGGLLTGIAVTAAATTTRSRGLTWAAALGLVTVLIVGAARPSFRPTEADAARAAVFAAQWATDGPTNHGFVPSGPRASRLARFACRNPATEGCQAAAAALAIAKDPAVSAVGRALRAEACGAGVARACGPLDTTPMQGLDLDTPP